MIEIGGMLNRLFGGKPYRAVYLPQPLFYDECGEEPAECPQIANSWGAFKPLWSPNDVDTMRQIRIVDTVYPPSYSLTIGARGFEV